MPSESNNLKEQLQYYLSPDEAARHAQLIAEDMGAIGFPIVISDEMTPEQWQSLGAQPQSEYLLPNTIFSIDSGNDDQAMDGSFLTKGNLLRLAQTVAAGRKWIPGLWPNSFAARILGPEHLDVLNEVWWLKFWRGLVSVTPGPKNNPASVDFDWALTIRDALADCRINLEVKRRTGNLNGFFKRGKPTLTLREIAKKFPPIDSGTANVVAITVYHRPDAETLRSAWDWLIEQPNVDGIVVWIEGNFGGEPLLKFFKQGKKWAEYLVGVPEPADLRVAGFARGTLCRKDNVPQFLDRILKQV